MKEEVSYEVVNSFIIAIKCCAIEEINKYLQTYDPIIVNRLETQTRQPSLYFSAILIDHELSYEIMKLLLAHGANPQFKDNYQQSVLFYVCREGKEKCLDLLLEKGMSLNDEDIYGQTPLFYVAKQNRLNIIHKLIEKQVEVNQKDKIANQTPLFYAAREGHLEMCKILIEAGANPSHQDTSHKTANHYAKKYGKIQVADYLTIQLNQNKVFGDSKQESNNEEVRKVKKKREPSALINGQVKTVYRLYRADALGNSTQVSLNEFEEFVINYPELQEMLKNPDQIDLGLLEEIKSKDAWLKIAQKVLSICWKSKGGYYFHEPVDPSKFGIDDYFDIIAEPMDFGTVKKKLALNVYNNVHEFTIDMKLVFDNCVKYNGIENIIAKHAIEIKNLFEENMKQTGFMN